jgi:hypothetical protein
MVPSSARTFSRSAPALLALACSLGPCPALATVDLIFADGFEAIVGTAWYADADGDGYGNPAVVVFAQTQPPGYVANALDCNDANAAIHPGAVDNPEPSYLDSNCDGIDGDIARSFFVSPQGLNSNPGTQAQPFKTITHGIAAAAADPTKKTVLVAAGSYNEGVALADGVNLYGQYQSGTWARAPGNDTIIEGASSAGIHERTVVASDIAAATTFEGFVIYGPANDQLSGNSYAVYVSNSSASLRISDNVIFGGHGGPGAAGSPGPSGVAGVDGAAYSTALDSFTTTGAGQCNTSNNRAASGGGVLSCPGADDVSGGNGGGNNCTPSRSTQNSTATSPATAGQPGVGGGSNGASGVRGYDSELNGSTCFLPTSGANTLPQFGSDGQNGGSGGDAAGVAGCATPEGSVAGTDWMGGAASNGAAGSNGGGGGGGAAGGGAACTTNGTCKDLLGGHGGGAGSGACGGAGGSGAMPGGGAFDIFVVGGAAPVVTGNTLFLGDGGDGGNGGSGGAGGLGGNGTQGGQSGALFCTGKGGRGGDGGDGGNGSGGGGGCGGASFAIYTSGVGTPDYCSSGTNPSFGGFAGAGGAGGVSLVHPGGDGQAGVLAACSFH